MMDRIAKVIKSAMMVSMAALTIVVFVIAVTIYGISSTGHCSADTPSPPNIKITLTHPTVPSVNIFVPVEYLGPKFLELSKKNRLGGEQARFLIEFYYPSMLPNTPENMHLKGKEELWYASVSMGPSGGRKRLYENRVTGEESKFFTKTEEIFCGLPVYKSNSKYLNSRTYMYFFDPENTESITYFSCSETVNANPCWTHIEEPVPKRPNLSYYAALTGVKKQHICEWAFVSDKVRSLLNQFSTEGE